MDSYELNRWQSDHGSANTDNPDLELDYAPPGIERAEIIHEHTLGEKDWVRSGDSISGPIPVEHKLEPDGPTIPPTYSAPIDTSEYERRLITRWIQPAPQCFPVVIVASIDPRFGQWACYIGGVIHGADSEEAGELVKSWGQKMPEAWATAIFPSVAAQFRYRE